MGRPNPSRETKFSGADGDRVTLIFPSQLTSSRIIDSLTRSIHTLLYVIDHTNIRTSPPILSVLLLYSGLRV